MTEPSPAPTIADLLARAAAAPDERLPLAETALALGALDRPGLSLAPYFDHLAELGRAVAAAAPADLSAEGVAGATAALRQVMAGLFDYHGDSETYDDLHNANLTRVIDRRRGLPVALGILYIHAARAQGWAMTGLSFPGHFLVRLDLAGERAILDPFDGGASRAPAELRDMLKLFVGAEAELTPGHYAPVPDRDIILRLQNNLKLRHLKAGQLERAIGVVDSMLAVAPGRAVHWREAGLINARLGRITAAVGQLQRFLELEESGALRDKTLALLRDLKARIN